MRIGDEAVEAAARVMHAKDVCDGYGDYEPWEYTEDVKAILEAAAPYLMAQAWDECASSLVYEDGSKVEIAANTNPYRSAGAGE